MKWCPTCKTEKHESEFARDKSKRDGLGSQCKACKRAYREANRENAAERRRLLREPEACTGFAGEYRPGVTRAMEMEMTMSTVSRNHPAPESLTDPRVEWRDVTADLASEWLKLNTLNRPKKLHKISRYAEDMKSGKWPRTGATICFGRSGRLLDGQNRLQAIVDSGVTIRILVVWGLDDEIFDVIDGGARRSSSDVLVIEGYEGWAASCGAAAARLCLNMISGRLPYALTFSPQNIRRFVNDQPDLMSSVQFIETLPRRPAPMPHSSAAALHFFMAKIDSDLADQLMTQLYRGDNMTADDMVLRLRNNLLGRVMQKAMTGTGDFTNAMAAVVRVWNARRAGRSISHIGNAFARGGEDFPAIK